MNRRSLLGGFAALPAAAQAASGPLTAERVPLWPGPPPGAQATLPRFRAEQRSRETWLRGIAVPTLEIFRPTQGNGVGLLAIPGGGYEFLAYTNEGTDIAQAFTARGYTVGVLTYRLPAEGWQHQADVPLQDAQRAMRLMRARAGSLGLNRVGVIGASAGGHLAATLATGYGETVYPPLDAIDSGSARPDFVGLLYPVATLEQPDTHRGSREHLLGADQSPAEVARRSPDAHVDARTPPSFLVHSMDDDVVPVGATLRWIAACRRAGVAVEAHLPERGGHGYSVHLPAGNPGALWPDLFERWIGQHARS